jgi:3D (Asp-Asp-Asp) domain-containing protein
VHIYIQRAKPAVITADGRTFSTRTQAATVAALLADEGVAPQGKDYSTPALQTAVTPGLVVELTRVREEFVTEAEGIAFTTVSQPDGNLELDQQRIVTPGKQGMRKRSIRIVYENGKEMQRVIDREWVDEQPTTQVIAYGTKIVIRTLSTPDGPIEYWRQMRVWATFYTPLLSGTALDAPWFGITFTGKRATKGIIAVDPRAINLHTGMYVPGYGFGAAEDTGNLVTGLVIDLCYDDDDSYPERWQWARWTTIYLLTPAPANIPWVLPDYPKERR